MRILLFLFLWMMVINTSALAQASQAEPEAIVFRLNGVSLESEVSNQFKNTLKVLGLSEGFSLSLTKSLGKKMALLALICQGKAVHQGYVLLQQAGSNLDIMAPPFPRLWGSLSLPQGETSVYTWRKGRWLECVQEPVFSKELDMATGIRWQTPDLQESWDEDWLLRSHSDTVRKAAVFRPDPCSRLRTPYGGFLRDRSDSNSTWLTQALDTIQIRVAYESDSFRLKSTYIQLGEFSEPLRPRAKLDTGHFLYTRDQYFFEEVNVYAHIHNFRPYLDILGFGDLAHYALKTDAHGLNGADMSAYSPVSDVLVFGDGNVDDAEDAAVIIHEYGHVLGQASIPFGNSGLQRRAIEEGICDYLAGSYCKQLSDWNWFNLFKWDGHNEFWSGRTLLSTKFYPTNLVGQIHRDGEIFSAFLTQLELLIGRDATHTLILSAMPFFIPEISMPQAAQIILNTDSVLFQGQNAQVLGQLMTSRGIHPSQIIVSNSDPKQALPYRIYYVQGQCKLENLGAESIQIEAISVTGQKSGAILNVSPMSVRDVSNLFKDQHFGILRIFTERQHVVEKIWLRP